MNKAKNMSIALLTGCSVSRNFQPIVKIADAPQFQTMEELCFWWSEKMGSVDESLLKTPGELYSGTSFTAVTEMAQSIGHENVYIVTGGIGLGRYTSKIPPYDFTSNRKELHNAHQHVLGEKFLPYVWWGMVNTALNGTRTPIADLLSTGDYDYVIGALPKMFTKYILMDLEACTEEDRRDKIFIPIPHSMYGSIPKVVKEAFVPYGPDFLHGISYSRGDKAQRVVQKMLRLAAHNSSNSIYPIPDAADAMEKTARPSKHGGDNGYNPVDYANMFEEYPELLDATNVYAAITRAKALGIRLGGNARFGGAWRAAKGRDTSSIPSKSQRKHAADVFASIMAKSTDKLSDDDVLLERLGLFVDVARSASSSTAFTAGDVVRWAEQMYPGDLRGMDNTNKVSYLLSYNAKYFGLEVFKVGSRKGFRLLP